MVKWEMVKLGDVATYVNGFAFKPEQWTDKGLPIIRIQNLNNEDAPFNYCDESINQKYVINSGDILVSWSASLGVFKWNRGKALLNQHIFKVVFDKIKVDKDFFVYTVGRLLEEMGRQTHGSTMKHITKGNFDNMLFPLPPIETQKQIAKTLDTTAELLAMRKQQLAELDNLIKSTFYDMFGDPEINPNGWHTHLLGDTADIVSGITKGRKLVNDANLIPVPYMRVANVQDGHLNLTEIKEIEVVESEIEKYRLTDGDLLMTEGGDPDKLGRCAIWKDEIPLCIHQNHIFRVRLDQERVIPEYASFIIGSLYGKKYFLRAAKQTTGIATINSRQLKNFPLLIPNLDLQYKFAEMVIKIEEQKSLVKKVNDETQHLFDSLMSQYFD